MREIKFRVWDKSNKLFLRTDEGLSFYMSGDLYGQLPISTLVKNNKCFLAQQFTGLKDKNGRDIYEGDILKGNCELNTGRDNVICRVEYNDVRTCFDIVGGCQNTSGIFRTYLWMLKRDIEIIGNIFENPELCKIGN